MHTEFIKQVSTKPLNGVMQTMFSYSFQLRLKLNQTMIKIILFGNLKACSK